MTQNGFFQIMQDLRATVQAIAAFLQRPLSVEQVNRIVELTAFGGMVQTYQQLEESEPDNKFRTRIHGIKHFLDKGIQKTKNYL